LLIVREHERISEQPRGVGPGESSVPGEIRRGKRIVRLSNLDKPYWPEAGITKGDLLRYYRDVASTLLPHIRDRPFTMMRYPDGCQGRPFFRKDVTNYAPAWVKRVTVSVTSRAQRRTIEAPVVNDGLALLWMVNTGCIECHTWYSRIDKLERPDRVVFDLDPSDDVGFGETVEVALLVKRPSTPSGWPRSRRPRVRSASTFSCRSSDGTRTTTHANSPPKWPERSPACTPTSRRPTGRRQSDEAS
jgi:hypothetical protein